MGREPPCADAAPTPPTAARFGRLWAAPPPPPPPAAPAPAPVPAPASAPPPEAATKSFTTGDSDSDDDGWAERLIAANAEASSFLEDDGAARQALASGQVTL